MTDVLTVGRPSSPILNTQFPLAGNVVQALDFSDGSGSTVTAIVGDDFTAQGTETTNFDWLSSVLNGGGIELLTLSTDPGGMLGPAQSGDLSLVSGTVVMVARFGTGEGGYVWSTGRSTGGPAGAGQAYIYIGESSFGGQVRGASASSTSFIDSGQGFPVDTWIPIVLTWDGTSGTASINAWHPTEGLVQVAFDTADGGLIIKDGFSETIGAQATTGTPTSTICDVCAYVRLDAAVDDDYIYPLLADPWWYQREDYGHVFLDPFVRVKSATTTSLTFLRTAAPKANVAYAIKYWKDGDNESTQSTLTGYASSAVSDDEELLAVTVSGLVENTLYRFKVSENLNGAGASELEREGFAWTATDDNTTDVVTAAMGDDHLGNSAPGDDAQDDADVEAIADVLEAHGAQFLLHCGDRAGPVKSYLSGRNSLVGAWSNWHLMMERPLAEIVSDATPGNHDLQSIGNYGVYYPGLNSTFNQYGWWQQWATELEKRFNGYNLIDAGVTDDDWAPSADIGVKPYAVSPNLPPFPGCGYRRQGAILHVWINSERYGAPNDVSPASANNSNFGPELAWAISIANASTALFKILDTHRPTGGMGASESYRRGQGAGVSLDTDYNWHDDYGEAKRVFNIIRSWHDHIGAAVRVVGDGCIVLSGGSPLIPFSPSTGYADGYNANPNDPTLGPFDDGTPLATLECLFYTNERGIWLHKANATRMLSQYVRTSNDARDGTLNEVIFTHETLPTGSGSGRTFSLGIGV